MSPPSPLKKIRRRKDGTFSAGNQAAAKPEDAVRVPFAARLPGDVIAAIEDEQVAVMARTGTRPSQADALAALVRRAR